MMRFNSTILGLLLLAIGVLAPSPAAAGDVVLRRFNSGVGSDAVGMIDASEDTEVAGPQAIYAGEGNEVFLLDQVNGRVLSFDPRQPAAQTRSFTLPEALEPTDLIVKKGEIFVWDGSVHALRPTGADDAPTRGLAEYQTRGIDDPFVVSAFSQMGSQQPGGESDVLNENTRSLQQQQRAAVEAACQFARRGRSSSTSFPMPTRPGARRGPGPAARSPSCRSGCATGSARWNFSTSTGRGGCSCSAKTSRRPASAPPRSSRASRRAAGSKASTSCRCRKASPCRGAT